VATLRTQDDEEFDQLLQEEQAALEAWLPATQPAPAVEANGELPIENGGGETATPSADQPMEIEWVLNHGSIRPRTACLCTTRHHLLAELPPFLEQHAKLVEPAASLARAIYHYAFEVPASIRATWNKEAVNGTPWHKIKRGRCRLYIRMNGAARLTCSAINRRDWMHPEQPGL
jgi:hypothetical protein